MLLVKNLVTLDLGQVTKIKPERTLLSKLSHHANRMTLSHDGFTMHHTLYVAEQCVLQAMTKRVIFQRRSGASASFVHVVPHKFAGVEVKVLMREAG
ncbi:hypothetical protein TNCV_802191 [Trichonephila clavipes]|nr:hypothetical protein TNCV_802191 [Trichonephila clavipes]